MVHSPPSERQEGCPFTHSFTHALIHSFIHALFHLLTCSFTHSFIHSLICSFIRSFIHSLTHLFIHPLTPVVHFPMGKARWPTGAPGHGAKKTHQLWTFKGHPQKGPLAGPKVSAAGNLEGGGHFRWCHLEGFGGRGKERQHWLPAPDPLLEPTH